MRVRGDGTPLENGETIQQDRTSEAPLGSLAEARIQPAGFLLELSLDWIVLRASENVHHLLGESHVTLIDEPLGRFVKAQALHDLRNLFSRLSGTTGIARAYRVRLTDDRDLFDIAFQVSDGRVLLEAAPSLDEGFGEALGTVGGLIDGLADSRGDALLDGGARRMRALTGYDRVTLLCGARRAESSRGAFAAPALEGRTVGPIVCDCEAAGVSVFPREGDTSIDEALMRAPDEDERDGLRAAGVRSIMRVEFSGGEFLCESRTARRPDFERHAAAELFAQLFAMQLEIDRLKP